MKEEMGGAQKGLSEGEMKEQYNKHFMQSLGADSMEEAMMIASAAGI